MYYFFSSWGVAYSFIISWVVIVAGGWPRSKKLLFIVIYYCYVKISCTEIESLSLALCKCASKCTLNKNIESFLPLNCWLIHAHLAPNITWVRDILFSLPLHTERSTKRKCCNTIPYCNEPQCSIATKYICGKSNILFPRFRYLVAINSYLLQWSWKILQPTKTMAIATNYCIALEI